MTDTTVQMTQQIADKHDIRLVPLHVIIDGKSYPENDIDLNWFYRQMPEWKRQGKLPMTSAPSAGEFLEASLGMPLRLGNSSSQPGLILSRLKTTLAR